MNEIGIQLVHSRVCCTLTTRVVCICLFVCVCVRSCVRAYLCVFVYVSVCLCVFFIF